MKILKRYILELCFILSFALPFIIGILLMIKHLKVKQ